MRLLILSHRGMDNLIYEAVRERGVQAVRFGAAQDMCSALYRDEGTVGVVWSASAEISAAICQDWRQAGVDNLIFVLLRQSDDPELAAVQRVHCLMAGADDVQPLPIDIREFMARLDALSRRERDIVARETALPAGAMFYPDRGVVTYPGGVVILSKLEAGVLDTLSSRPDTVITKEMLMDRLYGGRDEPELKIIDVFVCKIRRKLRNSLGGLDVIDTVWGRGYRFVPEGFQPKFSDARVRIAG